MKQTNLIMGMPITIEIVDDHVTDKDLKPIFEYFHYIDKKFSTYKSTSEISKMNQGKHNPKEFSQDLRTVLTLSEETKRQTDGYFAIEQNGYVDPSGLVKGWAIYNAANLLKQKGFKHFYIEAGGDIQVAGLNEENKPWSVGIQNPFDSKEIIKVLTIQDQGVATSGTYIRGKHIYNPYHNNQTDDIISLTVIGPNIYEADRFATAAFAMGEEGIYFIESLFGCEGYMIDGKGNATYTRGFAQYILN